MGKKKRTHGSRGRSLTVTPASPATPGNSSASSANPFSSGNEHPNAQPANTPDHDPPFPLEELTANVIPIKSNNVAVVPATLSAALYEPRGLLQPVCPVKDPLFPRDPHSEVHAVLINEPDVATMDYINCLRVIRPPDRRPFELVAVLIEHVMAVAWPEQSKRFRAHYKSYGPDGTDNTQLGKRRVAAVCLQAYIEAPHMFPYDTLYLLCETVMRTARLMGDFGANALTAHHHRLFWTAWLSLRFRVPSVLKHALPISLMNKLADPDFSSTPELTRWTLADLRQVEIPYYSPYASISTQLTSKSSSSSPPAKSQAGCTNTSKSKRNAPSPPRRRLGNEFYFQMSAFYERLGRSKGLSNKPVEGQKAMHKSMRDYASYATEQQWRVPTGWQNKLLPPYVDPDDTSDFGDLSMLHEETDWPDLDLIVNDPQLVVS